MTKFNQSKFKSKAKKLVVKYLNYQINEKDVFDEKEVFILLIQGRKTRDFSHGI